MRIATAALLLITLTACGPFDTGSDGPTAKPPASESTTPSASASPTGTPEQATDLVGDWEDTDAKWTVHFRDDGTYVEDFQGVEDFRVGTYTLEGDTVTLEGADGNADEGTVKDETLEFKLGTLERVSPPSGT